ncbi:MAG: hypothetical protein FJY97_13600 [candidate division Zixibacteria bacterium]|nr:hypothetical protein [candidate division Zixibacteria bacterium]
MYRLVAIRRLISRAGYVAAFVALSLAGCSGIDGPLESVGNVGIREQTTPSDVPALATRRVRGPQSVSQLIDARSGGVLRLVGNTGPNGMYHYIQHIPPGALTEDTQITMTLPNPDAACLDFGPAGLSFAKPARLTLVIDERLRQTQIKGEADVYWYNPQTNGWEALGGQVFRVNWKIIQGVVKLKHFSRYSLGGDSPIQKAYY